MSTLRSILPAPAMTSADTGKMTEAQFISWCDEDTWAEWVNGEVIVMAPVGLDHARMTSFLHALLKLYAEEHNLGEVLAEPFQIRFAKLRRRRSPDIIFVGADQTKNLLNSHFEGAPDLIVEVVSNESQSRDRRDKYLDYQAAGVKEYWIVDPLIKEVEAHALGRNKKYAPLIAEKNAIHSRVLPGLYIKPEWLWKLKPPKVADVLKEIRSKR